MHSVCPPNFARAFPNNSLLEYADLPRVFHNNSLCKIWGANRVHYGQLEKSEWERSPSRTWLPILEAPGLFSDTQPLRLDLAVNSFWNNSVNTNCCPIHYKQEEIWKWTDHGFSLYERRDYYLAERCVNIAFYFREDPLVQTFLCRALIRFELKHESEARKDIAVIKRFDSRLAEVRRMNFRGFFARILQARQVCRIFCLIIVPQRTNF